MAAKTYTELARKVPIWLNASNTDVTGEVDALIAEAHEFLFQVMDHDLFSTTISGLTIGTDGVLDLRAQSPRILEVRGVRVAQRGRQTPLRRRDAEYIAALYTRDRPGLVQYYTQSQPLLLEVAPKPYEEVNATVTANVAPEVLSGAVAENLISTTYPWALEQATRWATALFQKDWETAAVYEKATIDALVASNAATSRRRRDEGGVKPYTPTNATG